jgi:hypothetical protein
MSRQNDSHSSGQVRRASAQYPSAQDQVPRRVAIAQTSDDPGKPVNQHLLDIDDLLWAGVCAILGLSCLVTLAYWLWLLLNGRVDGTKLMLLSVILLIYALCVGGGWLWGKYQQAPVLEDLEGQVKHFRKQVETLQQQMEHVKQERQNLQEQLMQQKNLLSRTDLNQLGSTLRPGILRGPLVEKLAPPDVSIYEKQIDPADSSDLLVHPHEKRFPLPNEQNALDYNWCLIGASRRGYGHGYEGKYREDDFQIKILNTSPIGPALAVVALADGLSSKDLSRKGALASVEGATAISESQVAPLKALLNRHSDPERIHVAARDILLASLRSASNAVGRIVHDTRVSVDELHATLLVFLAAPLGPDRLFLASVQIGDGAIFGVRASSNASEPPVARWQQLLAPQIQGAGNEVQPFMRSPEHEWSQFIQFHDLTGIAGVMAMTDGIADDIEPPLPTPGKPEPDPFSMVDRFHQNYVVPTLQSPRPADELVRFIGYRRSQSLDDRTLVYLYHK